MPYKNIKEFKYVFISFNHFTTPFGVIHTETTEIMGMEDKMAKPHCWISKLETLEEYSPEWMKIYDGGVDSTCMLLQGHEGPHEFVPDSEIGVEFK